MASSTSTFGFIRKNFFPIHNYELKKLLPLNIMFFFIAGNYAMLRGIKDKLIGGLGGGALISLVKIAAVIPFMIVLKYVYDHINKRYSPKTCFYVVVGYFIAFYSMYAIGAWFYPNWVKGIACTKEDWFFQKLWKNLPNVLFYVHAEGFGTFVMSVSLWGFIGQIVPRHQVKRFFPQLMCGAALATSFGGILVKYNSVLFGGNKIGGKVTDEAVHKGVLAVVGVALLFSLLLLAVYYFFTKSIEANPEAYEVPAKGSIKKKKKKKLSLSESIKVFLNSQDAFYLLLILSLVVCYAIGINLFEGVWKDAVKGVGENTGNKQAFLDTTYGNQLIYIGLFSLLLIYVLSPLVMRQGWRFAALVVPGVFLIGSTIFFGAALFPTYFSGIAEWIYGSDTIGVQAQSIHLLVVHIGLVIVVIVKASKYVFFDPTKEATYLPLDIETRLEGKSAVDGVGSRIGKAGGAILIQLVTGLAGLLSETFRTLIKTEQNAKGKLILDGELHGKVWNIRHLFGPLILIIALIWFFSVIKLDIEYKKKLALAKKREEEMDAVTQAKEKPSSLGALKKEDSSAKGKVLGEEKKDAEEASEPETPETPEK